MIIMIMQDVAFSGKDRREILLVSQGKINHNIWDVRVDWGPEVLQEYGLKYDRALKNRNLLEIDVMWT